MNGAALRRCRPLLGTFVEITAHGRDGARLERAVALAFDAIERLQKRLSVHEAASDISRLNRAGSRRAVRVGVHAWRVLRAGARLSCESGGAFDFTLDGGPFALQFRSGRHVRLRKTLRLDLGGIAKGYCVDRAVEVLRRHGADAGLVNAGGDLRAFGAMAFSLHLRHPVDAARFCAFGDLRDAALATSARYGIGDARRSARRGVVPARCSVSVRAPTALLADALTKVVASRGRDAAPLLERHGARAWVYAG